MTRGLLSLVTVMLVGWSSAQQLVSSDDEAVDVVVDNSPEPEEDDADILRYFAGVTQMLGLARGEPSVETGMLVGAYNGSSEQNPEEMGRYFEGDILVPRSLARNGLVADVARWPRGVVPYVIDNSFPSSDLNMIEKAFKEYHRRTCVRFVRRGGETDYIKITRANTGCWSSVGRIGGMQEVNVQSPVCTYKIGTIIHELMHALGFMHEQNRSERDRYVTIMWGNIEKGRENNFELARQGSVTGFGVGYDYGSVMHYASTAFSTNNSPTIVPKISGKKMGQREGFSKGDIKKIRKMYKCPAPRGGFLRPH